MIKGLGPFATRRRLKIAVAGLFVLILAGVALNSYRTGKLRYTAEEVGCPGQACNTAELTYTDATGQHTIQSNTVAVNIQKPLQGKVTKSDGSPYPNVKVKLCKWSGYPDAATPFSGSCATVKSSSGAAYWTTDANGNYSISDTLANGAYTLSFILPDGTWPAGGKVSTTIDKLLSDNGRILKYLNTSTTTFNGGSRSEFVMADSFQLKILSNQFYIQNVRLREYPLFDFRLKYTGWNQPYDEPAVVANASCNIIDVATSQTKMTLSTDAMGRIRIYDIGNLSFGPSYKIQCSKTGYQFLEPAPEFTLSNEATKSAWATMTDADKSASVQVSIMRDGVPYNDFSDPAYPGRVEIKKSIFVKITAKDTNQFKVWPLIGTPFNVRTYSDLAPKEYCVKVYETNEGVSWGTDKNFEAKSVLLTSGNTAAVTLDISANSNTCNQTAPAPSSPQETNVPQTSTETVYAPANGATSSEITEKDLSKLARQTKIAAVPIVNSEIPLATTEVPKKIQDAVTQTTTPATSISLKEIKIEDAQGQKTEVSTPKQPLTLADAGKPTILLKKREKLHFVGKSSGAVKIVITIESNKIVREVTPDKEGNWEFELDTSSLQLEKGAHRVAAYAEGDNGKKSDEIELAKFNFNQTPREILAESKPSPAKSEAQLTILALIIPLCVIVLAGISFLVLRKKFIS